MTVPPEVAVIIVSWNTVELLDACLESVGRCAGDHALEVIVVDNGSSDGTLELLHAKWPAVDVIANPDNAGFCRANNQGIERSRAPFLLLINADAELTPGSLGLLLDRMVKNPRAAIVAPRLVYGDGRWQRWTAGRAPTLTSVAAYLFGLDRFAPRQSRLSGTYLGQDTREPFMPDWVSSACMLVRRAALDRIGLLDESIFVYMDDVELCQRARDDGWEIWYEPQVDAIHLMGQSTKRQTGAPSPAALRGFNRYFRARHGRVRTAVLRACQAAAYGGRAAVFGTAGLIQRDPGLRQRAQTHFVHMKLALESPEVSQ